MNNKTIIEFGFRRMISNITQISGVDIHLVLYNFQYQVQPHSIIVNHNIAGTRRNVSPLPFPPEEGMESLVPSRGSVYSVMLYFFSFGKGDEEHSCYHLAFDQGPLNCYNLLVRWLAR